MKKHISQYKLLSLLGTGGMSEVYLAQDTRIGTKVAIKILDRKLSKDPEYIKRFKREVEISKTLSHPNIIKIISCGTDKGRYYIVYEYIEGMTLDKYIKSRKLSIKEIEDVTLQILKGLSCAHSKNIIHRDIKPSNIMISNGNVKILDFGIARATTKSTITKTGMFMGSPHYTSPEQIDGKKIDHRTDIYSLGIVLYEMVEGKIPFKANTPLGFVKAHTLKNVPKIRRKIPNYLSDIIFKCLSKKPTDRFKSVEKIMSTINSNKSSKTESIETIISDSKKISTISLIVIGLLITCLIVMSIFFINNRQEIKKFNEILKNPPLISNILITPENPNSNNNIVLTYDINGAGNSYDELTIKWYKNGKYFEEFDGQTEIDSSNLFSGDNWYAVAIPYKGEVLGEALVSNTIKIFPDPMIQSMIFTWDYSQNIYIEGNYAYITGQYDGLKVVDIENKKELKNIEIDDDFTDAIDVCTAGDYAFIATANSGLLAADISNRENPILLKSARTPYDASSIFMQDNYLYITDWGGSLQVIDVSDESSPEIIGNIDSDYINTSVYVEDNYAYVAYGLWNNENYCSKEGGMRIVDISDKEHLKVISDFKTPIWAEDIFIKDGYAFVVCAKSDIKNNISGGGIINIIDIQDKDEPKLISTIDTIGEALEVSISDKYLYVSQGMWDYDNEISIEGKIQIIDIVDKENPEIISEINLPGVACDFEVVNNYIYIAAYEYGLIVIKVY